MAAGSEAKESLESGRRRLPAIVPKYEFVEVNLELALAHAVIGANEPLLQVADSSIGKWDGGLRTLSQLRAERLGAGYMFKAGLLETFEALEAVRIDGGTGRDVPGEDRDDRVGLEVGNHVHASSTGSFATLLNSD